MEPIIYHSSLLQWIAEHSYPGPAKAAQDDIKGGKEFSTGWLDLGSSWKAMAICKPLIGGYADIAEKSCESSVQINRVYLLTLPAVVGQLLHRQRLTTPRSFCQMNRSFLPRAMSPKISAWSEQAVKRQTHTSIMHIHSSVCLKILGTWVSVAYNKLVAWAANNEHIVVERSI